MDKQIIYLIYDGQCPICSYASTIIQIRRTNSKLELINARVEHPMVLAIKKEGWDLNNGIIVKYQDKTYYGQDAIHFLAIFGSTAGSFNKIGILLFKSKILSAIFYPILKFIRKRLLLIKGVAPIVPYNEEPIFKPIFGSSWEAVPSVLKKHYANRPYCDDIVKLQGNMDIELSNFGKLIAPLLGLLGALVPYEGKNIPTTVYIKSQPDSNHCIFERYFNLPNHKPYPFCSRFAPIKSNEVVEFTKFCIGWRHYYNYADGKIRMIHKDYVWQIFGFLIPIPISLAFGKGYAEVEPINDRCFKTKVTIKHPYLGKVFEYKGQFEIV